MWFQVLNAIAIDLQWKLVVLSKGACSASPIQIRSPDALREWSACDQWHRFAIKRINQLDPTLLVVTQTPRSKPDGSRFSQAQWRRGMEELFKKTRAARTVVLGNTPLVLGPECLVKHVDNVQTCSNSPSILAYWNDAERAAAASAKIRYIDVTPWFCASSCSSIIGNYNVYFNAGHVSLGYSVFLEGALKQALGF
jgi:hypothetical protein